jgi:hypothetical protein
MTVIEWARSVKADLVRLQQEKGIPALFAAAQMCHESAINGGADLSELAKKAFNFSGLKAARWQRDEFGCGVVNMATWEVYSGKRADVVDGFCACNSWEHWLKVYAALLTGDYYGGALAYNSDPMLYGAHIWLRGWATDTAYLTGLAHWMTVLYDDYKDTLPKKVDTPIELPAKVTVNGADVPCGAFVRAGHTFVHVRPVADALGASVEWNQATQTVELTKPKGCCCCNGK